jgi:hypothetical protein
VADPHAPHIEKQIRKYERWWAQHHRQEHST